MKFFRQRPLPNREQTNVIPHNRVYRIDLFGLSAALAQQPETAVNNAAAAASSALTKPL
jgi:hypothetical protein